LLTCRCAPLALPASLAVDVLGRYGETHRAYHTAAHIAEVLGWFDIIQEGPRGGWRKPREVYVAIVFHDVIYEPAAKDNEARSAALARAHAAELGVDGDRVAQLIELTARHGALTEADVAGDPDAAMFLDADMAILGAEPAAFDAYDAGIRFEYAAVPDEAYRAGRGAFLQGLLAKPRIYLSGVFHEHLDAPARANLARAIARLAA
jgi:predicted metal-dependent HD superfamily phosphohydrolase